VSDPRLTPANARVAAAHLPDAPAGVQRVTGTGAQVAIPVADLRRAPEGARDRQVLFGEVLTVYETRAGWSFVQAQKDGYVGYVLADALVPERSATHWVAAPATHVYSEANLKSPERLMLCFGSRITGLSEQNGFLETPDGFIPVQHVSPLSRTYSDPVEIAAKFLGVPYLWGGNSWLGIDCSGLVQAALLACGIPCPGDSDLQQTALGTAQDPGTEPQRNDLLFWRGHVALVVGPETLIHANAFHMATAYEPLQPALERIATQGDGPVTSHIRL